MSTANDPKFALVERIRNQKVSVWNEFVALAQANKPVDLGQGFPDFAAPSFLTEALKEVALSENTRLHQYTRGNGHPRLVSVIGQLYTKLVGRPIDGMSGVLVTVGAYESLYLAINAHVQAGDEVIIIEPFFDCYSSMVELAGGTSICVPLRAPENSSGSVLASDWKLDPVELESKFNAKTKMIIINTPHNPLGKVFSRDELQFIAGLCQKYNTLALMDEVYEWLVYDGAEHIRMCTLPDMWDRTLTVGSAGKTFSVTGWKLGWIYGPEHLLTPLKLLHQNVVYTCPTPIQEAVALSFEKQISKLGSPDCYWTELANSLKVMRDRMVDIAYRADMKPTIPQGGYFILCDFTKIGEKFDYKSMSGPTNDYKFSKWLSINKKLQGIPPSVFYSDENKHLAANYIRLCFFKKDDTFVACEKIIENFR